MAKATTTTTTRPRRFPGRTISPNSWDGRSSTIRPSAASNASGEGYDYDHDVPEAFSGQDYFPEQLGRQKFYDPPERGFEREIKKRLEYWAKLRRER